MTILDNVILALAQSVPQLDTLVPASTDNLAVVWAKRDAEHIIGVSNESAGGEASI